MDRVESELINLFNENCSANRSDSVVPWTEYNLYRGKQSCDEYYESRGLCYWCKTHHVQLDPIPNLTMNLLDRCFKKIDDLEQIVTELKVKIDDLEQIVADLDRT